MSLSPYQESLSTSISRLCEIREQIFDMAFRTAITNELKDWSDTIDVGETVTFSKELLESCEDTNVQLLIHLLTQVERTVDSLVNLNNLPLDDE